MTAVKTQVRFPVWQHALLSHLAEAHQRSLNQEIVHAVDLYLALLEHGLGPVVERRLRDDTATRQLLSTYTNAKRLLGAISDARAGRNVAPLDPEALRAELERAADTE